MKKRIISLLLIAAMALSLLPATVLRADAASQPVISVEEAWSAAGSTVEVDVTISGNPGILGATLTLSWAEGLTLVDAENGDAFANLSFQEPNNYKPSGTNFLWYGSSLNNVRDGVVLELTFQVDENVEDASRLAINISGSGITDTDKNPVSPVFVGGGVRIVNYVPGDVDGNDAVDTPDLIILAKYIVDDCKTDPDGYNVSPDLSAADVNDDGEYTALDLVLISQYIVDGCKTDPDGYNVVLKPVTPKCSHTDLEEVAYKAATCTQDGNVKYYSCGDCGKYFNSSEAAVELTWSQIVLTATGHTVVVDQAVAPTYTSTGLTEGSHCGNCGEVFVAQEEVPMLQANYHSITYRNLNGAENPEPSQYAEHTGLDELPVPEVPGYIFKGWYTASEGGTVVDYIPAGSTQNYTLFARWELITYSIRYFEAPENENVTTYTVEDEIYLNDPNWPGLGFTGWTEENGNVTTELKNGKTFYKIPAGTTGNLDLTANWKLMRNIAVPGTNTLMLAKYNPETGRYIFTYELGTIENVVLEELNSSTLGLYRHTGAGDFTLTMSQENTMEESFADSITQTISRSVSSSSEWEDSKEWAKEISNEHSTHVDIGVEFGNDDSFVKASIETGYGYANTNTDSWGGSETKGGSYGEETENGEEVGSSFSYLKSMTTASEASITISGSSPHGYYDYVQAGNIRVFGIVTYDSNDGNVYMNTYSILDNMHGIVLYYPDVNALNNPTCETLQYSIPRDNIAEKIANSYFVEYVTSGGYDQDGAYDKDGTYDRDGNEVIVNGSMNRTMHTVGGVEKLAKNEFTREGYIFTGWETREEVEGQNGPVSTGTYTDEQVINTSLASNGETVTMYALWEKIDYTIEYAAVKPSTASTQLDNLPGSTGCKYDENVTLAAAPTLPGYTFGGWYYDSTCTQKAGDAGETLIKPNLVKESGGTIKLYPKWTANTYTITFNVNGGSMTTKTMNVVFDKTYDLSSMRPTKNGHVFQEWVMADGSVASSTGYWRIAENVTLTAKWLMTEATLTLRQGYQAANKKDKDCLVTDSDKVYQEVDLGFDREALKKAGYTKVKIYISLNLYGENKGYREAWIRPYYDKTATHMDHYEASTDDNQWEWWQNTFIDLNIDNGGFSDTLKFYIEFGAHGDLGDDWYLGDTTIKVTVIK